jgi:hypothetical protein
MGRDTQARRHGDQAVSIWRVCTFNINRTQGTNLDWPECATWFALSLVDDRRRKPQLAFDTPQTPKVIRVLRFWHHSQVIVGVTAAPALPQLCFLDDIGRAFPDYWFHILQKGDLCSSIEHGFPYSYWALLR